MKPGKLFIIGMIIGILAAGSPLSMAGQAEKTDYWTFTALVQEWSASSRYMQIDDIGIGTINAIFLDTGNYDKSGNAILTRTGTANIKEGIPVTVEMKTQGKDGLWITHRVIVYKGKGIKKALNLLPKRQRQMYKSSLN
ncbi:hypothetical protein DO021_01405 [Desulfobacter hydrogenophilus]|uniref:Uncharacterized protein n=1 Tax=Desulfobacter hydrogenophilus TaxID=2291 RepID=A0A328FGK0_9BACT|nr:hypothetical protein [Desulfobacter hydrogenophilus]NDY71792.1 hypothetical protein [Desulfobacter hydrogenophilus]QBH13490.1 hypothetical protein EYB58_11475 [Desulfobacter hydrogenophilus]RAM03741.1 hypothetical protein DO021_01405 [Desulfobacter hydrogenophilus]